MTDSRTYIICFLLYGVFMGGCQEPEQATTQQVESVTVNAIEDSSFIRVDSIDKSKELEPPSLVVKSIRNGIKDTLIRDLGPFQIRLPHVAVYNTSTKDDTIQFDTDIVIDLNDHLIEIEPKPDFEIDTIWMEERYMNCMAVYDEGPIILHPWKSFTSTWLPLK